MLTELELGFSSTYCNGWPNLNIHLNGLLYKQHQFSSSFEKILVSYQFDQGPHLLTLELHSKTNNNTKLVNGTIVEDQLLTLDYIKVDNVKLPDYFLCMGKYTYKNSDPKQGLTWGINGQWLWQFTAPIIDWIINIKNIRDAGGLISTENNTHMFSDIKHKEILEQLNTLNQRINDINI
jgi:hypothetical protein